MKKTKKGGGHREGGKIVRGLYAATGGELEHRRPNKRTLTLLGARNGALVWGARAQNQLPNSRQRNGYTALLCEDNSQCLEERKGKESPGASPNCKLGRSRDGQMNAWHGITIGTGKGESARYWGTNHKSHPETGSQGPRRRNRETSGT